LYHKDGSVDKEKFDEIIKKLREFFCTKLDFYFYKELIPNYFLGLLFFTFIMMLNELYFLVRFYVEYNVPISQVFILLMNLIPFLLSSTIPIGILPAYLLTMGRLSLDSEIIAMKACGVSALRIIRPGIVFGIAISLAAILFTDVIVVKANMNYIKLRAKIVAKKPAVELKEKSFVEVGGYKISFDKMVTEGNMEVLYKIHVIDISGRKTIEAERGRFYTDPENTEHYILKFINGSISEVVKSKDDNGQPVEKFFVASFRYLSIHSYVALPDEFYSKGPDTMHLLELAKDVSEKAKVPLEQIGKFLNDKKKVEKEIDKYKKDYSILTKNMSKQELVQKAAEYANQINKMKSGIDNINKDIKNYQQNMPTYNIMKLYEKFALPLASIAFALISLSIGMYSARSGRNEGLGISIIIMLMFFGIKFGSESLIMKGTLPPIFEWFPNFFFLTIGLGLMIKKVSE
jgi:lipopolysaccharide export LptBFGC system permease protein LptF